MSGSQLFCFCKNYRVIESTNRVKRDEYHKKINNSIRKMGASVDWSRERFTLDDSYRTAVTEAFVRLHQEGLIYRANRLVHFHKTATVAITKQTDL